MAYSAFGFYSNTIRYNEQGFTPNEFSKWVEGFDTEAMIRVLKRRYQPFLETPVWINFCKQLKNKAGTHSRMSRRRKMNRWETTPKVYEGMDKVFLDCVRKAGWYHRVKVAEYSISSHIRNGIESTIEQWSLQKFYNPDILASFPVEVFIFHVLAHEFHHALQVDKLPPGGSRRGWKYTTDEKLHIKSNFSSYHRKSKMEMDAEQGAREDGNSLVIDYLREVGNDHFINTIAPEWGY